MLNFLNLFDSFFGMNDESAIKFDFSKNEIKLKLDDGTEEEDVVELLDELSKIWGDYAFMRNSDFSVVLTIGERTDRYVFNKGTKKFEKQMSTCKIKGDDKEFIDFLRRMDEKKKKNNEGINDITVKDDEEDVTESDDDDFWKEYTDNIIMEDIDNCNCDCGCDCDRRNCENEESDCKEPDGDKDCQCGQDEPDNMIYSNINDKVKVKFQEYGKKDGTFDVNKYKSVMKDFIDSKKIEVSKEAFRNQLYANKPMTVAEICYLRWVDKSDSFESRILANFDNSIKDYYDDHIRIYMTRILKLDPENDMFNTYAQAIEPKIKKFFIEMLGFSNVEFIYADDPKESTIELYF